MSDLIDRQDAIHIASGYCHPANIAEELRKLPAAQPEQQWIPCSERRPKKSGKYYVSGGGKVWICEFVILNSFTGVIGGWCNDATNPVVQAWKPLPEPYKERREE